ncbi:DoxX family membrane protein [Chlorobium sp. BLA1]|uniref:MauE/DoxX family redox-associated membrane protein n=1 Tax=Candidatus Chlorobium masyuteum TaxID=2716876 RepID=UPI00141E155C|nr:MauE/DoxX family redox-associated membrane protein [Candidatus Chlorobium masyuteum]NHQ59849.1 DoxX family membrane protein [Candidatus Chlorobium masyuteum]
MASIGFPSVLITALRLILGALFILSGGEKLLDLNYFALVIAEYQILPSLLIPAAALLLSLCELLCGTMLLLDLFSRFSSSVMLCMMAIFIAAMTYNVMRGLDHDCGCFEFLSQWYGLKEEIGIGPIVRDIFFFILLLPIALRGSNRIPWKIQQG